MNTILIKGNLFAETIGGNVVYNPNLEGINELECLVISGDVEIKGAIFVPESFELHATGHICAKGLNPKGGCDGSR